MTNLIIGLGVLLLLVVAVHLIELFARGKKPLFEYSRQDSVMTAAERECFAALTSEMGMDYHFFPQVHLDSIVRPSNSQRRFNAFRHINQKSVDFVACDIKNCRPMFVIEVDDKTHSRPKRIERDKEVQRILSGAGIPLVRIENRGRFESKALAQLVRGRIEKPAVSITN